MNITSALVLFAVIWFMILFVALPLRLKTQGDVGEVTPGTPAGAPAELNIKRTFKIVTVVALVLWVIIASIVTWGGITVRDLDMFNRMAPATAGDTNG